MNRPRKATIDCIEADQVSIELIVAPAIDILEPEA